MFERLAFFLRNWLNCIVCGVWWPFICVIQHNIMAILIFPNFIWLAQHKNHIWNPINPPFSCQKVYTDSFFHWNEYMSHFWLNMHFKSSFCVERVISRCKRLFYFIKKMVRIISTAKNAHERLANERKRSRWNEPQPNTTTFARNVKSFSILHLWNCLSNSLFVQEMSFGWALRFARNIKMSLFNVQIFGIVRCSMNVDLISRKRITCALTRTAHTFQWIHGNQNGFRWCTSTSTRESNQRNSAKKTRRQWWRRRRQPNGAAEYTNQNL